MKKTILCAVFVCVVFSFTVLNGKQQPRSGNSDTIATDKSAGDSAQKKSIREVQAAFDLYIDAWKRADVDALSRVYASDARVTGIWPDPTLQYPVQGWTGVRQELNRVFDFTKGMGMAYSPRHVEIYGDVAIMTTNWEWVDPDSAQPGSKEDPTILERRALLRSEGFGKGQATFVFFHRDHRWLLVHEHASVLPPDK